MDNFKDWQFSKEAQERLEKLCSQMPEENIEEVDPAVAWLFRKVMENIVQVCSQYGIAIIKYYTQFIAFNTLLCALIFLLSVEKHVLNS